MHRRSFLRTLAALPFAAFLGADLVEAAPKPKSTSMTLFGWGSNPDGGAGLGDNSAHSTGPVAWTAGQPDLVQVACGDAHAAGIDANGDVWVWGFDGGTYRLGTGSLIGTGLNIPTKIVQAGIANIVEVTCTHEGTFLRRNDGAIFFAGTDTEGESGNNSSFFGQQYHSYTQVAAWPANIVQMVGGQHAVVMRGSDGKVWYAGDATYGQAGDGATGARKVPTQWGSMTDATWVTCATYDVIVIAGGHSWGSGRNQFGEFACGDTTQRLTATDLGATDAVKVWLSDCYDTVTFGSPTSWWLTSAGVLSAAGANTNGQVLDNGTTDSSAHTARVTQNVDGKVITDFGRCWSLDTALAIASDGTLYGIMSNIANQMDTSATTNYATWQGPLWPSILTQPVSLVVPFGNNETTLVARMPVRKGRAWAFVIGA